MREKNEMLPDIFLPPPTLAESEGLFSKLWLFLQYDIKLLRFTSKNFDARI